MLAPRINAAGRMEHAELAVQLFLSDDPAQAQELAETLCRLNRERQSTESEIYREASDMVRREHPDDSAIVLAGENWHQGVIGIVASRLCEEFCRPTFLICMNGEHGKASSRSYGGFNLFRSLQELAPLLEGYGGHEFAAGFTIPRENIDVFRQEMCRRAQAHRESGAGQPALEIDCAVQARLLTEPEIAALAVSILQNGLLQHRRRRQASALAAPQRRRRQPAGDLFFGRCACPEAAPRRPRGRRVPRADQ